jgi:hypothetical protein
VEHQIVTAAAQDGAAGEYRETERGRLFVALDCRVKGTLKFAHQVLGIFWRMPAVPNKTVEGVPIKITQLAKSILVTGRLLCATLHQVV